MALTADQITAQNFKDFYGEIRPYLSGQVPTFANAFNRSDLYSTDEKIIGTWIDGKPIYQKVVTGLNIELSWKGQYHASGNMASPIADVDKLIFAYAMASGGNVVSGSIKIVSNILDIVSVDSYTITTLVAQYTKTTDQAIKVGTGNDYSTDEQIIGTWIDGKPLYQKTIDLGTNFAIDDVNDVVIGTYTTINVCVYSAFYMMDTTNNYNIYIPATSYITKSNGSLQAIALQKWAGTSYRHVYYTIQYTKTTD